jgi:hypothetical protein
MSNLNNYLRVYKSIIEQIEREIEKSIENDDFILESYPYDYGHFNNEKSQNIISIEAFDPNSTSTATGLIRSTVAGELKIKEDISEIKESVGIDLTTFPIKEFVIILSLITDRDEYLESLLKHHPTFIEYDLLNYYRITEFLFINRDGVFNKDSLNSFIDAIKLTVEAIRHYNPKKQDSKIFFRSPKFQFTIQSNYRMIGYKKHFIEMLEGSKLKYSPMMNKLKNIDMEFVFIDVPNSKTFIKKEIF